MESDGRGGSGLGPRGHGGRVPEDGPPAALLLIAEDTPVSSTLLIELLRRRGYGAEAVPDGAAAVEAFARRPYAAILMDIQMPGMDGHEATREIRRREPPGCRVPIIAVTAHVLETDREAALSSGMDDYIPKPVRATELDRVLDRWLAPAPYQEPRDVPADDGPLDPAVLEDLRTIEREGGAAIVSALLEAFVAETPGHLEALRQAAADGDAPAFKRTAHTLSGICRGVGARQVATTCLKLENLSDTGDLQSAQDSLTHVRQEWEEAKTLLAADLPDSYPNP